MYISGHMSAHRLPEKHPRRRPLEGTYIGTLAIHTSEHGPYIGVPMYGYTPYITPCTTHAQTHARPSLPVVPDPNPAPAEDAISGLHDTAAIILCIISRVA